MADDLWPCIQCGVLVSMERCPFCSGRSTDASRKPRAELDGPHPGVVHLQASPPANVQTSAGDDAADSPAPRGVELRSWRLVALAGLVAGVTLAVAAIQTGADETSPEDAASSASVGTPSPGAPSETSAPAPTSDPTPLSGEMLNVDARTLESAYGMPEPADAAVSIMSEADGRACDNVGSADDFGQYPAALCKTWKPSTGLTSAAPLSPGELLVACQADLGVSNPVFTEGQENTWWIWARSDAGTWDWFPETALSQGESMQPTNGIALCRL